VIAKVLRRARIREVLRYLFGPGNKGEHHNPHVIAGFRTPAALEPPLRPDGRKDLRELNRLLTQPLTLLGDHNHPRPVWHVPVRAAPEDPVLTDEQWARIAAEIMHRSGLAPHGDETAVRWVAVRHADDHIHIVATLARQDGRRPRVWNDAYRVRAACLDIEARYGLRRTAPADRTAAKRPTRAETEKSSRQGRAEPARVVLRRHVQTAAAGARSEEEFFDRLRSAGVLIRTRFSRRDPDQLTGYAVALPEDRTGAGTPVWYGGGKLAADLTLPKLRRRWSATGPDGDPQSADYHPVTGRHLSARSARAVLRRIVRQAADRSQTIEEFLSRLEREGLLVKRRYSELNPGQVTGYAVTLPDHVDGQTRQPLWYSGGRLADDLTLPRLQQRWQGHSPPAAADGLTVEERQGLYEDAARATAHATAQLRRHLALNPHAARDACWAAADVLRITAKATGNRHLHHAADAYDRAARPPYARIPPPTPAGNTLRSTARLLTMAGLLDDQQTQTTMALITALTALMETISHLQEMQQNAAQAAASRSAGHHLRQAAPTPTTEPASPRGHVVSAMEVAMMAFPHQRPLLVPDPSPPPQPESARDPRPRREGRAR
jgi:hypothetical protein